MMVRTSRLSRLCPRFSLTHFLPGAERIRGELQQVAVCVDDQKRSSPYGYSVGDQNSTEFTGEPSSKDLALWLSPPDPFINYNTARDAHHKGTGVWFTESSTFKSWKESDSLLWIHGKRLSSIALRLRSC